MDKQPVLFGRRKGLQSERQTAQTSSDIAGSIPDEEQHQARLILAADGIAAVDANVQPAYVEVVPKPIDAAKILACVAPVASHPVLSNATGVTEVVGGKHSSGDDKAQAVEIKQEVTAPVKTASDSIQLFEADSTSYAGLHSDATSLSCAQTERTARKLCAQESTGSQGAWMASMFEEPNNQTTTKSVTTPTTGVVDTIKHDARSDSEPQLEALATDSISFGKHVLGSSATGPTAVLNAPSNVANGFEKTAQSSPVVTISAQGTVTTTKAQLQPLGSYKKQNSALSEDQPWMTSLFNEDKTEDLATELIKSVPADEIANVPIGSEAEALRTDSAGLQADLVDMAADQLMADPSIQSMGWYSERDRNSRRHTVMSMCSVSLDTFLVHSDTAQLNLLASDTQHQQLSAQDHVTLPVATQLAVTIPTTLGSKQSTSFVGHPIVDTIVASCTGPSPAVISSSPIVEGPSGDASADVPNPANHENSMEWYSETRSMRITGDSTASVGLNTYNIMPEQQTIVADNTDNGKTEHRTSLGFTPAESVAAKVSAWEAKLTQSQKLKAEGPGVDTPSIGNVGSVEDKGITSLIQACESQAMLQACDESLVRLSQGGSTALPASKSLFSKAHSHRTVQSGGGVTPLDAQHQALQLRSAGSSCSGKMVVAAPSPLELLSQELLNNVDGVREDEVAAEISKTSPSSSTTSCATATQQLLLGNGTPGTRQLHQETAVLLNQLTEERPSSTTTDGNEVDNAEEQRKQILQAADLARQQLLRAIQQHDVVHAPEGNPQHVNDVKETEYTVSLPTSVASRLSGCPRSFSHSAGKGDHSEPLDSKLVTSQRDATRRSFSMVQSSGMESVAAAIDSMGDRCSVAGNKASLPAIDSLKEASCNTLRCGSISSMHNIIPCVGQNSPDVLHTQQPQEANFPMFALAQAKALEVANESGNESAVLTDQDTDADAPTDNEFSEIVPCDVALPVTGSHVEADITNDADDVVSDVDENAEQIVGFRSATTSATHMPAVATDSVASLAKDVVSDVDENAEQIVGVRSVTNSATPMPEFETDSVASLAIEASEAASVESVHEPQVQSPPVVQSSAADVTAPSVLPTAPMETTMVAPLAVEVSEVVGVENDSEQVVEKPTTALPVFETRKVSVGSWPRSATQPIVVVPVVRTSQLISHELEHVSPTSGSEVSSPRERKPSVSIISFADSGSAGGTSHQTTGHAVAPVELQSPRASKNMSLTAGCVVQPGNSSASRPASRTPRYSAPVRGLAADGKLVAALALLHGSETDGNSLLDQTAPETTAYKSKANRSGSPGRCVSPRLRPARQAVEDILHFLHEQHALRHAAQPCTALSFSRDTPNTSGANEHVALPAALHLVSTIEAATEQEQFLVELLGEDTNMVNNGCVNRTELHSRLTEEETLPEPAVEPQYATLPAGLPAALVPVASSKLSGASNIASGQKPITANTHAVVTGTFEENVGLGFEHGRVASHSEASNELAATLNEQVTGTVGKQSPRAHSISCTIPGARATINPSSPTRHRTSVTITPSVPDTGRTLQNSSPRASATPCNMFIHDRNSSLRSVDSYGSNIRTSSAVVPRASSGQACQRSSKAGSPAKSPTRQSKASEYLRLLQMSGRKSAPQSNTTVFAGGVVASPPPLSMRKISAGYKDVGIVSGNSAGENDYTQYTFTPQKREMQGFVPTQNISVAPNSVINAEYLNTVSRLQTLASYQQAQPAENAVQLWCSNLQLDAPVCPAAYNIPPPSSPFKTLQHLANKQLVETPSNATAQSNAGWVTNHTSFRQLAPVEIQRAVWGLLQRKHEEQGKAAAQALAMILQPDNGLEQLMSTGLTPVEASHLTSLTKVISGHKVLTPHERMGLWTQIEKILLSRLQTANYEQQNNCGSFVAPLQQPRSPRYPHATPSREKESLGKQACTPTQPYKSHINLSATAGKSPVAKSPTQQPCTTASTPSKGYKQSWDSNTGTASTINVAQEYKRGMLSPHVKIVDATRPSSAGTLAAYRNANQNGGNKVDATLSGVHRVVAPNATMALAMDRQWNAARYQQ